MNVLDFIVAIFVFNYYWIEGVILAFIPKKKKEVKNEIVLVTGAGSGIGRLVSIEFAKLGSIVVIWDVNEAGNVETAKMIKKDGGKVFAYTCDLSNKDEIYKTAERVKREVGKVSILVNNAGIVAGDSILKLPDNMVKQVFAVNTLAHFWTVKLFLPGMLEMKKGHVVTIASIAGLFGLNRLVDYCSSKYAAIGFHDSLTAELRVCGQDKHIKTTVICPYMISTGMFSGVTSSFLPILKPEYVCNKIVNAVLTNKERVLIPSFFHLIVLFKTICPAKAFNYISDVFGAAEAMNTFQGRNYVPKKAD